MVGLGLAAGLGVASWAAQSQDSTEIKSLGDAATALHALTLQVATLEARVESLEDRRAESDSGGAPAAAASPAAAPAGAPVLKVESVEAIKPDEGTKARAQQLIVDAETLEQKAAATETASRAIIIDSRVEADEGQRQSARRQMQSLKQEAGEARRQARQKRSEAEELTKPRQVIRGWSGKRSVEAYTERDLSAALSKVAMGSFLTGKWTLFEMDDQKATVRVSSITPVSKPADFVERPTGSPK
jgi:hypothetical protein